MTLKEKCEVCSSWQWCGRPCSRAPQLGKVVPIAPKPAPSLATRTVKRAITKEARSLAAPDDAENGIRAGDVVSVPLAALTKLGRPTSGKERIAIRLSSDVLARFRATGKGWQARIDEALRRATP